MNLPQKKNASDILEQLLIFFACFNLFGKGSIVFFIFGIITLFTYKKIILTPDFVYCVAMAFSILFATVLHYSVEEAIKAFIYPTLYLYGYNSFLRHQNRSIYRSILSIWGGFSFLVILTCIYNLSLGEYGPRVVYNIWGGSQQSATMVGLFASVVIGFSIWCFLCARSNRVLCFFSLFSLTSALILNVRSATRTPFVLLALVGLLSFGALAISSKIHRKRIIIIAIFTTLFCVLILLFNPFGIITQLANTPIVQRFSDEALSTSRLSLFIDFFKMAPKHIWGGEYIRAALGNYQHFFLFQFYDLYGLLGTIPFLFLSVSILRNIFVLFFMKNKTSLEMLILIMSLSIFLQCCLEPVITGYPILLWSLLIIHGQTSAFLKKQKASRSLRLGNSK